ncbi:MAG: hypothetical protein RI958_1839 [Actinomycetota bacterium]|jgi:BirA family biotin operon repressor/biotin-[acetyl-CoA-carboxylase] ligase
MDASDATWHASTVPAGPPVTWPSGWTVEVVDETGSTNADLLSAAAEARAPDRAVLVARHQRAGRGRLDRRWEAPAGANLLVSLLFRTVPEHPHELTQRVALAAAIASERLSSTRPVLKWPNDLLVVGPDGTAAKLAGVLAEAGTAGGSVTHVVVGLGLNVGWAPEGAALLGRGLDPLVLLAEMLAVYDSLPDDVYPVYCAALHTLGKRVRVERAGSTLEGRAIDVGRDGRLEVLDDCAVTHRVDVGDVIHLRPA